MKAASILIAASMAGAVAAQKLSDYFPECSISCLEQGTTSATDCSLNDAVCFCVQSNYEAIYNAELSCVLKACGADVSVDKVLPAAIQFCSAATESASATATGNADSTSATSAPATTTTSAASSKATETSAPQTTSSAQSSSAAHSSSAPQTTAASSTPVGSGRPVTTASTTTSFSTAAAAGAAGPMVTAVMLVAGAVAML
ncbi:hypothetical protein TrVFT333_011016 [Trichoderma virens FT-333]|nr:hypothetical protein TrVFT333_011016 [Trichoderma virens FT-333]